MWFFRPIIILHEIILSNIQEEEIKKNVPDYVITHGILSKPDLEKLLKETKVCLPFLLFIGVGWLYHKGAIHNWVLELMWSLWTFVTVLRDGLKNIGLHSQRISSFRANRTIISDLLAQIMTVHFFHTARVQSYGFCWFSLWTSFSDSLLQSKNDPMMFVLSIRYLLVLGSRMKAQPHLKPLPKDAFFWTRR